ncbi:hypothetical protein D9Q98_007570 [Chlorella vulgaris]|uniref:non-specific serine/threonine protein kinase n=1 Tax=Chlorella vulgaris TaxID=3077 RepID=A0A9D4TLM4_CHLVU|nr:hypothetical protein D9Q98_007570 [Chlorella vulgaris]
MGQDSALSTETVEQVEPPDDDDGFHFAETDPSHRFGRFDAVLGRGAFKIVYKAFDTQEGTEVAWNQVRVSELMSVKDAENKEERDRLFAEIRVLKALKHKNIMSFYDSWYDPRTYTVSFITELFTSGTLRQYRKKHKHIDEEVVKRWAWQILCGLVYLHGHSPPIIHRDLKCDNIFINGSDGVVKIGDLGLATMLRSRTAPQSVLGTPEFMAPELYEEEYDDRVDVYSFGMCLLELSTMEYPYSECKNAAQIYRKVSLGVRPAGLQKVASPQLAEFINLCISARESRPRARQLLKHPYFDSIRKDKLLTSRSDAALAAHPCVGETASSEYGSLASGLTSGPVSRTASSLSELVHGVSSTAHSGLWGTALAQAGATAPPLQVVAAAGSAPVVAAQQLHPLSRTVSASGGASGGDSHSDKAPSDAASVRSQRSNASELAAAVLENIAEAEENEVSDVEHTLGGSPTAGSRQGSPPGSPVRAGSPASPVKPGSPTLSDGCRCHSTERRFVVKGDLLDSTRVQLRLRICEPNGTSRTVEFEFDEAVETVAALAGEMVSDLELTPDDASVIATALEQELNRLSAEPQIDKQQSINLVHAALALPAELKSSALGQAHSAMGRELMLQGAGSLRQAGRFSEQTSAPLQLQLSSSPITQASAHPPADVQQPAGQQPPQHPPGLPLPPPARLLRRSSSSSSSLVSASSVASLAHSVASAASQPSAAETWVQQQLGTVVSLPPNFSLARASPPPRAPSTQPGLAEPRSAPRPMSPLDLGGAGQADFPSPHQRVLRSHSIDATSMLSRSASLPPGREPVAPPFNGSGALSPSSGILSPAAAVQEKRLTLMSLFENLADYQKQQQGEGRTDSPSPGLESAMVAAASASLPPLPHAAGGRPTQPSSSCSSSATLEAACGAAAAGQPAVGADVSSLLRPRSEACLSGFALQRLGRCSPGGLVGPGGAPGSAPTTGGGLAAAAAAAEAAAVAAAIASPTYASSNASPRSTGSQGAAAAVVDTIQRLDLQSTAPVPIVAALPLPLATDRIGAYALSAPASKLPSRDASPSREREGSLSPTRIPCGDTGSGNLYGKRPPLKADKEALRRQAADAMKAVELRSLNLLEGGLGASKAGTLRGVPMAAARSMTALCNAVAPGLAPHSNGIAAMQHVPAGNGVMGGAAHPPPMAPPSAAASAALSASQMGSPSVSQLVLPHPVT